MHANYRFTLAALLLSASTFCSAQTSGVVPASGATPRTAQQDVGTAESKNKDNDEILPKSAIRNPVIWRQQTDIAALDLYYGQGGVKHQPKAPFTFRTEDMNGTNPKFDVLDADGTKWRVKLGEEPRPEVVSSRLLWAIGYYVNEDYLLPKATVPKLAMRRKSASMNGETITDARFARKPAGEKKIGTWAWKDNPFVGTREFNGLRVMMAVLNNWDLKDVNNAVYSDSKTGQQVFLVSDVGATFATNSIHTTRAKDKGNIDSYKASKFITKVTAETVSFGTPAPPSGFGAVFADTFTGDYMRRMGFDWIGRDIPIKDAQWVGSLLGQLSHQQILDAFRAGHFPPETVTEYVTIVENRIAELKTLQPK